MIKQVLELLGRLSFIYFTFKGWYFLIHALKISLKICMGKNLSVKNIKTYYFDSTKPHREILE